MKHYVFLAVLMGAVSAFSADVTVSNSVYQLLSTPKASGGDTLTATSADYGAYPSGLATPAFWFDASDRSGWTVGEGNAVTRVPSKSNARYLTSDVTGASWTGWGGVTNTAPVLAYDEDLGAECLDFGATGSLRAMIFDAEQPAGCTATNKLSAIGTAFMVIGSQNGGGWVFGGGATSMINWHRGLKYSGYTRWTPYNPLSDTAANCAAGFYYGYTRHDGENYIPWSVGYNGGWEVFSFAATNAAEAAALAATGVGVNDGRAGDGPGRSGGMKLAEMIVFNEVLTLDQVKLVEKWLRKKWFGYAAAGENGHARLGELVIANTNTAGIGKTTTINSPAGQTFKVELLRGGRNNGGADADDDTLTVTGAGAVDFWDATRYNGDIVLAGGTLKFGKRSPVPTAAQLPRGLLMRFDVSDADSVTTVSEHGTNFITKIANLTDELYNGVAYSLRPTVTTFGDLDRRPWLQAGWTPTGLPLADFGPHQSWNRVYDTDGTTVLGYRGRSLKFYMGEASGSVNLTTAIAVIDPRRGGGWLMNQGFQRASQNGSTRTVGLLQPGNLSDSTTSISTYPYLTPGLNGAAYINGERVANPGSTGYNEGLQVVALQIPGSVPDLVGAYWDRVSGALVFGELLLWNRPLTETEIRDASAYLAKKWMGATLAGYARDEAVPDVQNLANTAVSTIDVEEGATARVGALTLGTELVKTGAGTLEIGSISNASNCRIVMGGGSVRFSSPLEPSTAASPAVAPALRFDPTETNDWTLTESGGAQHIAQVLDRANGLRLYHETAAYAPIFSTDAGLTCNGLPVADFGASAGEYSSASSTRYALHFNRPLESVRAVYAVWRLKAGSCAFFMGSSDATHCGVNTGYRYDWHRGTVNGGCSNGPLFGVNTAAAIKNGEILTNGVPFAYTQKPVDDEWRLMEVHTTKGVHISALGTDRAGSRTGGMVLGEVLVYERPLNAREKVATRNYLLKKWFGKTDGELAPLPEIAAADDPLVGSLLVDETAELDLEGGGFAVKRLYGEGTLVKRGGGTVEVMDALAYSGTVHVAEGAFLLKGHAPDHTPELATRGLAFHLDAGQGVTVTTNGSGRVEVPVWNSVLNDGWKAVSATGTYSSVTVNSTAQYVPETDLDGRSAVRMAASGTGKYECYRFIDPNGGWNAITNIRSALWVIGSQEGGGFLFGGGDHTGASGTSGSVKYYAWHRGSATTESAGRHKEDPLTSTSGFSEIYNYSSWSVNGTAHGARDANPFSGGWDVVSCRFAEGHSGPADGLAYDGRIFAGENYLIRCGNQRLAELLVYTNRLSDTELLQTEAYLNAKWSLNGCIDGFENEMKVVVDDGAAFDLGGHRQYVASLGGEGIVSNGTVVAGAVVADADAAPLTVQGTFEVASGMKVELRNLASLGTIKGKTIPILSATSYAGLENLSTVVFTGETFSDGLAAKLSVVDGVLSVTFTGKGSVIFFK